jgi:hypothetical protein
MKDNQTDIFHPVRHGDGLRRDFGGQAAIWAALQKWSGEWSSGKGAVESGRQLRRP